MSYTIKQIAELSGVSARTLRFYDERGLLRPAFLTEAGYRMYTDKEIDRLQQILLYRSMGIPLKTIKELIDRPDEKIQDTLIQQRDELIRKRGELDRLLQVLEDTLGYYKGEIRMTNKEKFDAFKQQRLLENEENYGTEVREKYGEDAVAYANQKWQNMGEKEYGELTAIEGELTQKLSAFLEEQTLPSPLAKEVFELHKSWLQFSWKKYFGEAHKGVAEMYLADERFTRYYDGKSGVGAAEALYQIIQYYA